ncbi:MAG: macro domain-containing protein [Oscillospiraceae bacterium]|nr:macro domain-containing protein [Oscillospiraceae bacterium]
MPLYLIRTDITNFACDAAVFAADESLRMGGAMFGAACSAGGPDFLTQIRNLGKCGTGEAKCIRSSHFPCRYIILTAAPVWKNGSADEQALLKSCYTSSLRLARRKGCRKIAVSLIDSHMYGFPPELSREIAVEAIEEYLARHHLEVYLVSFDLQDYAKHADLTRQLDQFLAGRLSQTRICAVPRISELHAARMETLFQDDLETALDRKLRQRDESFQQALFRLIDERGMKDSECYRRANVTKATFSKIRLNPDYHPKKQTALAFAVALRLDLQETDALLRTAGYALSKSSKMDIIVEFFITRKFYDVDRINAFLYDHDQLLLGGAG